MPSLGLNFRLFSDVEPDPNDIDVFLLMHDSFELGQVAGEAQLVFNHAVAQSHFGASVFWLRRLATQARRSKTRYRGSHAGTAMIANDQELKVTLERIAQFQAQAAHLRKTEANPADYRAGVSGFLSEIDRMQLEVREYLSLHPRERTQAA